MDAPTYEVVTVVIALLAPDAYLDFIVASITGGLQKVFWKELALLVEVVTSALFQIGPGSVTRSPGCAEQNSTHVVDQDMHWLTTKLRDELSSIVLFLRFLSTAVQVPAERLLAPRTVDRVGDGGKGRAGAVLLLACAERVQVERQRTMAPHRVPKDRLPRKVLWWAAVSTSRAHRVLGTYDRETSLLDDLGKLDSDVSQHVVMFRILRVRCIHVEAGAWCGSSVSGVRRQSCSHDLRLAPARRARTDAKVPAVSLPLDACTARRGVGEDDSNALLSGGPKEAALLRALRVAV